MPSPARDRTLRLLVGLLVGAALVFLIAADTAQAVTCNGKIGQVTREQGRRGTVTTIGLQFSCDTQLGDGYAARVFTVHFGGAPVDTFEVGASDSNGRSYSFDCASGDNEFDCSSTSGPLLPNTTISGTPSTGEEYEPVCSVPVTVTVYGAALTEPYVFTPQNLCPSAPTKQTATLTVKRAGTGSGSVTGRSIDCPDQCSNTYPLGTAVTLTAHANDGSTFTGWSGGGCSGPGTCTVTLSSNTTVTAAFNKSGGTQPTGKLHASVDSSLKVSGTSLTFTLVCHAPSGKSCAVLAVLTATQHMRSGKVIAVSGRTRSTTSKKVVTLAKKSLTIASGAQKTVTLTLNKTGKTLLARFKKLPARITVGLTNTTKPTVVVSKTVTFKQQKTKRGR